MKKYILSLLLLISLVACEKKDETLNPGTSFTKIFDNPAFSGDIHPLSVVEIPDSGYLILAAKDTWNVYLLRTQENGDFTWELSLGEPYVNPLSGIIEKEGQWYIACMDEVTLGTYLLQIDLKGGTPAIAAYYPEITYPLSISNTPDRGLLLQGYDRTSRSTTLTKINKDFTMGWQHNYDILEDKEEQLINHLTRTGPYFPFFNGFTGTNGNTGYYFFNGYFNFTLSLVFVDASTREMLGNINGFREEGYINALHPMQDDFFALSRISFDDNYLLPKKEVNVREISFSGDFVSNRFPEISAHAKVVIKEKELISSSVVVYGTHSKNNQLLLYAYDKEEATLLGMEHIGQTNPYQMGDFIFTADGGLLVLSKTYLAKRFPRLALFKLTEEEVLEMVR